MGMPTSSHWIWTDDALVPKGDEPFRVLFRKVVAVDTVPERCAVKVSADSRYKLWVNGELVSVGPCKGDAEVWFADTVDIADRLRCGDNAVCVEVLRFPDDPFGGNQSVITTFLPGLYLEALDAAAGELGLDADASWRCRVDTSTRFVGEQEGFAPLHFFERAHGDSGLFGWMDASYDDGGWDRAVEYHPRRVRLAVSPGNLHDRRIPFLYRTPRAFLRVMRASGALDSWDGLIHAGAAVTVPAHSEAWVELDAGEETTGYLYLRTDGGAGARIELLQSEAYVQDCTTVSDGGASRPQKADREDCEHGHLEGYADVFEPAGLDGEAYSPFWFRTFRFIRLTVRTTDEPLTIRCFDYEETGYPLEVTSHVETSDASLGPIWDISARTLARCMHETYEDCPFYEQLQYVQDSRAQALFTYASSADDRMARAALDDFRRSQRGDGMLCSAYPNTKPNVIPGFSLYYIWMLHDHMMYFGDRELVELHMPAVEQVLAFFGRHVGANGMLGHVGSVHSMEKYWSFIDWAPGWLVGVPPAVLKGTGALTMEALEYILGLEHAADLARFIGRDELACEYDGRAQAMRRAVRAACLDANGLLMDGPDVPEYSQHCQVFGVLAGVFEGQEGRAALEAALDDPARFALCSVSMGIYVFEALRCCGMYERADERWNVWREMVRNNMTTCAESDNSPRSECHAWGSLALHELPAVTLGVRPAEPGFARILIDPTPGHLAWAKGVAETPYGPVEVSWELADDGCVDLRYKAPEGVPVVLGKTVRAL